MHKILVCLGTIGLLLGSSAVQAHGLHGASFMAGLAHPWLGLDHLLALLAMGVSVAGLRVHLRWGSAALLGLALAAGVFSAGVLQLGLNMEPLLAASLLVLALLCLRQSTSALVLRLGLLLGFSFLHGWVHGLEVPAQTLLWPFASGVVLASLSLFVLGMGLGRRYLLRHPKRKAGFGGVLGLAAMGFLFGV